MAIVCSRFVMYKNFLDAHSEYEKIFITDIRDVIFQEDIFERYSANKNFLVYATEFVTIKHDRVNTEWIKALMGETEYQKICDKPSICAATILASYGEMKLFLTKIIKCFKQKVWGEDQAAMNYLVHNKLLPIKNFIESNGITGEMINVYFINLPVVNEKILRGDNGIPAIVHEYDVRLQMAELVDRVYRANFQPVEEISDVRSSIDQIYCLVQRQNWSLATKIFVNKILYADNLNIHSERLIKLWEFILKKANARTFGAEILIAAVQKVIPVSVSKFTIPQIEKIYSLFLQSDRTSELRQFLENIFFQLAELFKKNGQREQYITYIKRVNEILKE